MLEEIEVLLDVTQPLVNRQRCLSCFKFVPWSFAASLLGREGVVLPLHLLQAYIMLEALVEHLGQVREHTGRSLVLRVVGTVLLFQQEQAQRRTQSHLLS